MSPSAPSRSVRADTTRFAHIFSVAFVSFISLAACGNRGSNEMSASEAHPAVPPASRPVQGDAMAERDGEMRTPGTFSPKLLTSFLQWVPVLEGDVAFESRGHGGILVRSYLSPSTAEYARKAMDPYPVPVGSQLAKAVVPTESTPASEATRVYFMRKEAPGFDPENGDWSYAVAKRTSRGLAFDPGVGPKEELCVSCHAKFARFDHVMTVDFFRMAKLPPGP